MIAAVLDVVQVLLLYHVPDPVFLYNVVVQPPAAPFVELLNDIALHCAEQLPLTLVAPVEPVTVKVSVLFAPPNRLYPVVQVMVARGLFEEAVVMLHVPLVAEHFGVTHTA
mgnify:CR=1 FL=1